MYGCGLPVCAAKYDCIGELVKDGRNGLLFSEAGELADQLILLLEGFPTSASRQLTSLTDSVAELSGPRWEEAWAQTVQPLIIELLSTQQHQHLGRNRLSQPSAAVRSTVKHKRHNL